MAEDKPKIEQEDSNVTPKKPEVKTTPEVTVEDLNKLREHMDNKFKDFFDRLPLKQAKPKKEKHEPQTEPHVPTVQTTEKPKEKVNTSNIVNGVYIG